MGRRGEDGPPEGVPAGSCNFAQRWLSFNIIARARIDVCSVVRALSIAANHDHPYTLGPPYAPAASLLGLNNREEGPQVATRTSHRTLPRQSDADPDKASPSTVNKPI